MLRATPLVLLAILGGCAGEPLPSTTSGSTGSEGGDEDDDDDEASSGSSTNGATATSASEGDATNDASTGAETTAMASGDDSSGSTAVETSRAETSAGEETSGAAACGDLEACCNEIGADLYGACITVVDMGNVDLCDSILGTYHTEGYCTGEPYCDELGACCGELPPGVGWQDTCEYYADLGNQPQCLMLIGDYQLSGYCE